MEKKYREAMQTFIEQYKKDKNVVGILATGSVVHSKPDKNSDIDIHIVVQNAKDRTRGNTFVNTIEIEYFINPVKQIRAYFKNERQQHTAHMFANSLVLFERGKTLPTLIAEAKKILKKGLPPMSNTEKELAAYTLDDFKKDLEDIYLRGDKFGFKQEAAVIQWECIEVFCNIKRIRREKNKRLEKYLAEKDPAFVKLLNAANTTKDTTKEYLALCKLIAYTEHLVGGPRPKEWKLQGPLSKQ